MKNSLSNKWKWQLLLLLVISLKSGFGFGQIHDTISGFLSKNDGEEITYFSPRKKFADRALLTRANGNSSISWNAPINMTQTLEELPSALTTYTLLVGFSSGTSSSERTFTLDFNGYMDVDIITPIKKSGQFNLKGQKGDLSYEFVLEEYDQNGDAFGMLYITLPTTNVIDVAQFSLTGVNQDSRDWMMVFMYEQDFKCDVSLTNLISKESKRQVSIDVDNPYTTGTELLVKSKYFNDVLKLKYGFNHLTFFAYDESFVGVNSIVLQVKDKIFDRIIEAKEVKPYTFHIIHHSHNDIGYSHLQTEVEEIQNQNIYSALNWIDKNKSKSEECKAIWHIESLWAVENFFKVASDSDKERFKSAVKSGNIVLSANYVNVLTGLCLNEELNWLLEYAKMNASNFGKIEMAMITDIPGITASGLRNYVRNDIAYLSLGPNYVHAFPDHGDRVGGVINMQGDKVFYWKDNQQSKDSLLVWTAGKGYSFFHNIQEQEKKDKWEDRISAYCQELNDKNYPFEMVQLRYTKKSDNGPVDTNLCTFVENWNQLYKYPKLQISSVPTLFQEFEKKYGKEIATVTGEISPYWEDGAYSTAIEEANLRLLVKKTIALEQFLKKKKSIKKYSVELYKLHRNIVLFQEHTWGAWCSISDPELPFTTEQWKYKKAFLDEAQLVYSNLEKETGFILSQNKSKRKKSDVISSFEVDPIHGGIVLLDKNNQPINSNDSIKLFEPLYSLGINTTTVNRAIVKSSKEIANTQEIKSMEVELSLPSIPSLKIIYTLFKKEGRVTCRFIFDKLEEKNKEALHFAFPLNSQSISYASGERQIVITKDQLPGSNVDFICTEDQVEMLNENYKFTINSPAFNLFEIGTLIDETTINGVKVWNQYPTNLEVVYLYVLNNYWHTNYKAYQSGHFDYEVEVVVEKRKK